MTSSSSSPHDRSTSTLDAALAGFADMVRRVAWRHRLRDADVDEVMQEVRIRLWKSREARQIGGDDAASEQNPHSAASYVYKTAVSAAIDLIRRQRSERARSTVPLDSEAPFMDHAPTAEAELDASELAEQVARAVETIPASRRPAVRMYLAGYSREDIADLMGWSEAKTRNLVYRGLDDLRRRLTELGIDGEARG